MALTLARVLAIRCFHVFGSRIDLASRKVCERSQMGWALAMRMIKRYKGIRWMPWHAQAMKDVIRCDKPRGAANKL
jgi:hypothetical protein